MSSKRKCGPFPLVLLPKDSVVGARLDFGFYKGTLEGEVALTEVDSLFLAVYKLFLSVYTVPSCFAQ